MTANELTPSQQRAHQVAGKNIQSELDQLLEKKKQELFEELQANQEFAVGLWREDKVSMTPIPVEYLRSNVNKSLQSAQPARLLVKNDNRFSIDVDMYGDDKDGKQLPHFELGWVILDSEKARQYVDSLFTGKPSKKLIKDAKLSYEFNVKHKWANYEEGTKAYNDRQQQIEALRVTERNLHNQLMEVRREIESLDYT